MFDSFSCSGDRVSSAGSDVDLLNLNGRFEGASVFNVDKNGAIYIEAIEIDRILNFIQYTYDHELLTIIIKGFSDSFGTAEKLHGNIVANDGDILA